MTHFIRSSALTNYVRVARELGLDPYQQLSKAGIRHPALLDPDVLIAAESMRSLLDSSARDSKVEDFGLRMAETRQLTDLGPLGFAIQGEPTLRKALESIARYLRLQSESALMDIDEVDDLVVIRISLLSDGLEPQRQSIELVVAGLYRLLRRFLGDNWKARSICFSHSPPVKATVHKHVFGMQVLFNQEFDGIVCRAFDLEMPMAAYDPLMASEVRRHLDALLAESKLSFPEIVRRLVHSLLPSGSCSVETVALHLRVDRRTVHRRLQREGESFSAIHQSVREELAVRLAKSPGRSLNEFAELLGFGSASAFARWFQSRFHCSVSQWRTRQCVVLLSTIKHAKSHD